MKMTMPTGHSGIDKEDLNMVLLSEIYDYLNNVKLVTLSGRTKEYVDMNNKEKYEVVSISSIYGKYGIHVRVKKICTNEEA